MNSVRVLWWFGFLAVLAGPLRAAEYTGKVVGISDGDTLTLLVPDGVRFKQVKGAAGRDRHARAKATLRDSRPAGAL